MGTVYEALQISLNRHVAVKLLSANLLDDPFHRKLFENESRLAAILHHPNIVQIFSAEKSRQFCCFAMELVDGKPLNECAFHSIREIASVGLQAAQALAENNADYEKLQALTLLKKLLTSDSRNPEYRFQFVILLTFAPELFRSERLGGLEPNALQILKVLCDEFPERPEYALAFVQCLTRKLKLIRKNELSRQTADTSRKISDLSPENSRTSCSENFRRFPRSFQRSLILNQL